MDIGDVLRAIVEQTQWARDTVENTWRKLEANHAIDAFVEHVAAPAGIIPTRPSDGTIPTVNLDAAAAVAQELQQAIQALTALQTQQAEAAAAAAAAPVPEPVTTSDTAETAAAAAAAAPVPEPVTTSDTTDVSFTTDSVTPATDA